jgi:rhodanese-related sulfurtransferase
MSTTRTLSLAPLAALLLILGACAPRTTDRSVRWVTPEEAQRAMNDRTGVLGLGGAPNGIYLDPRNDTKFQLGHIPGAVHIPFPQIEPMFPTLRDRTVIVVYATDFSDDDFAVAASKRLLELGARNVLTIRGGLRAWEQAGNEVAR